MSKYKVRAQVFKDFIVEAETAAEAQQKAAEEVKKLGITDEFSINEPKDLTKKSKKYKNIEDDTEGGEQNGK